MTTGGHLMGHGKSNKQQLVKTIGPWEGRPSHFDDARCTGQTMGILNFSNLQGTEVLYQYGSSIMEFSHNDQVATPTALPFVENVLDSIDPNSTWGSVRTAKGHLEPFKSNGVAIGNEDCEKKNYNGNYLKFYYAITDAYPDIKMTSNCDGSSRQLEHLVHMHDFHACDWRTENQMDDNQEMDS